ncbi:MAG: YncE family protein [Mycobacterium sp.]
MVVQWTMPIGARVCDVVTGEDNEVYVATDDAVTAMAGNDVAARIPVGPDTKRLVLGADGASLYVVGYDGSVRIIGTADHTVTTIYGGPSTAEVVSPLGGTLYTAHVASGREGTGSVITATAADGKSMGTVLIDNLASGMDLSPDGGHLYVATSRVSSYTQYFAGLLTVIDTARHEVVDSIALPSSPDTVTISHDGSRVLVTHFDTYTISAVDMERRSVVSVCLPDAPLRAVVPPTGTGVYVICMQSLVAVDFENKIAEIIPVGGMPRRMQFTDDGTRAYVADLASSTVAALDTTTNAVIAAVKLEGHPETVALSGDGQRLYVADYWAGTLTAIAIASVLRDAEAA